MNRPGVKVPHSAETRTAPAGQGVTRGYSRPVVTLEKTVQRDTDPVECSDDFSPRAARSVTGVDRMRVPVARQKELG